MIIAGTGHRPKYMPGKYNEKNPWQQQLKQDIKDELEYHGPVLIISGGALGFDMFLAEAAIELNIPFDLYLPFKTSGANWPVKSSKERLSVLKNAARRVTFTSWEYSGGYDFIKRDYAMVDDADLIYSCLNPEVKEGGNF